MHVPHMSCPAFFENCRINMFVSCRVSVSILLWLHLFLYAHFFAILNGRAQYKSG